MQRLDDAATRTVVMAERAFLHRLEGGCQVPIAGHGRLEEQALTLTGLVAGLDGRKMIRKCLTGPPAEPEALGVRLAERLLADGADTLLVELQNHE